MSRTTPWLALLLVATAACSEGDGPVDVPFDGAFDEAFTLTLPQFRPLVVASNTEEAPPVEAAAASAILDPSEIPADFQQLMQSGMLITEPSWADAGFASDHEVAFGMAYGKSKGNFYRNSVTTTLRYNGSNVATAPGEEAEWSYFHLPFGSWGEPAVARVGFTGTCGHEVHVTSRHEAELRLVASLKLFTLLSQVSTNTDYAAQPPCSGGNNPNGGGGGDDEQWYICYWVDVYDANGDFLYRQDLGCEGINVS